MQARSASTAWLLGPPGVKGRVTSRLGLDREAWLKVSRLSSSVRSSAVTPQQRRVALAAVQAMEIALEG